MKPRVSRRLASPLNATSVPNPSRSDAEHRMDQQDIEAAGGWSRRTTESNRNGISSLTISSTATARSVGAAQRILGTPVCAQQETTRRRLAMAASSSGRQRSRSSATAASNSRATKALGMSVRRCTSCAGRVDERLAGAVRAAGQSEQLQSARRHAAPRIGYRNIYKAVHITVARKCAARRTRASRKQPPWPSAPAKLPRTSAATKACASRGGRRHQDHGATAWCRRR